MSLQKQCMSQQLSHGAVHTYSHSTTPAPCLRLQLLLALALLALEGITRLAIHGILVFLFLPAKYPAHGLAKRCVLVYPSIVNMGESQVKTLSTVILGHAEGSNWDDNAPLGLPSCCLFLQQNISHQPQSGFSHRLPAFMHLTSRTNHSKRAQPHCRVCAVMVLAVVVHGQTGWRGVLHREEGSLQDRQPPAGAQCHTV